MKNKSRFGIWAIIAIIAVLALAGCGDGSPDGSNDLQYKPGDTVTSTTSGMVLTLIPAGSFTMGQVGVIDATPPHQVTLTQGFYMGISEVTQEQWRKVMGNDDPRLARLHTGTDYGRGDNFPMYYVNWYDVILFCNRLSIADNLTPAYQVSGISNWESVTAAPGEDDPDWNNAIIVPGSTGYRLSTVAQWEYACRAGTTTSYSTGATISTAQANFNSSSAAPVKSYSSNAWGLYDMHGNVWEHCWDWFLAYPSDGLPRIDPVITAALGSEPEGRGGSWFRTAGSLRSATRSYSNPYSRYYDIGFRVVLPY